MAEVETKEEKEKVLQDDIERCQQFFEKHFGYKPENMKAGENSVSFKYGAYRIRFPREKRKDIAVQDYAKEAYISKYIRDEIGDLPVPKVELKEKDGITFSSHQEIKGKTLIGRLPEDADNIHMESLSAKEKKQLALDLGAFLAKLHSVPLAKADKAMLKSKQMGVEAEEKNPDFLEKNKKLYQAMGIDYHEVKVDKTDLVLSHNDFHSGNFAVDENNCFSGAFDLGEMGINNRYRDFMSLYANSGREFMRDVVASYNKHSEHKVSMQELDFHYLNKIADYVEYAKNPEYSAIAPKLKEMFSKGLADFTQDKQKEQVELKQLQDTLNSGKGK